MPTDKENRANLRKFLELCVKQDLEARGEHALEIWERHAQDESGGIDNIYKLTGEDRQEIKTILAEYRQTREQEETEREQRRLAEEHADEILTNHYADRIRKIILSKPNKLLPKTESKSTTRRRMH